MIQKEERRLIDALYWGGVLIWAGLVFGADSLGYLPQIGQAPDAWSWIFFGAGLYGLLGSVLRMVLPDYSNPTAWDYIWSIALLIVGINGFVGGVDIAIPLILFLVGVAWVGTTLLRR